MPKKVIDLGFCPRCKGDFYDSDVDEGKEEPGTLATTRVVFGIRWCRFCSFDVEDSKMEQSNWIPWAKSRAKMEGLIE